MGLGSARTLWLVTFFSTIILDQVVKILTRMYIPLGAHGWTLVPGGLGLRHAENYGVAFGQLQGWGVYLAPIALVITFLAWRHTAKHPEDSRWIHFAMGLLASGAIGNMIDRLARGKVTDMFELQFVNFPVFNIADACITLAALVLVLAWSKIDNKESTPAESEASNAS